MPGQANLPNPHFENTITSVTPVTVEFESMIMSGHTTAAARLDMVERQIRRRGVRDGRVLAAMESVPRHYFVPAENRHLSYADCALPLGSGQTISQPYMVAAMTEALDLPEDGRVLEVGTGSGYQTAVLAEIASEVYTVERIASLSQGAQAKLESLGYKNVHYTIGDGCLGWKLQAPFDGILVTAAAAHVPSSLLSQLEDERCMVIPVGGDLEQDLYQIRRHGLEYERQFITRCRFVPLVEDQES